MYSYSRMALLTQSNMKQVNCSRLISWFLIHLNCGNQFQRRITQNKVSRFGSSVRKRAFPVCDVVKQRKVKLKSYSPYSRFKNAKNMVTQQKDQQSEPKRPLSNFPFLSSILIQKKKKRKLILFFSSVFLNFYTIAGPR